MNKVYFEELDSSDQERVIELLYKSKMFISDIERLSITGPKILKKVKKFINSDNKKRTISEWFSWSITEATRPTNSNSD